MVNDELVVLLREFFHWLIRCEIYGAMSLIATPARIRLGARFVILAIDHWFGSACYNL